MTLSPIAQRRLYLFKKNRRGFERDFEITQRYMMENFKHLLDIFFSFKPYVMLPLFMLIIGLLIRMKLSEALMSALKLAVGFAGIFIVFSYFVDTIKPAVEAIMIVRGLDFPVLDVGWPPLAAITWSSPIAPLSIPLIIAINILMIATKTTKIRNQ